LFPSNNVHTVPSAVAVNAMMVGSIEWNYFLKLKYVVVNGSRYILMTAFLVLLVVIVILENLSQPQPTCPTSDFIVLTLNWCKN
jgi:hypothetical protein